MYRPRWPPAAQTRCPGGLLCPAAPFDTMACVAAPHFRQMPTLDPNTGAAFSGLHARAPLRGKAQPGLFREDFVALQEASSKHKDFRAPGFVENDNAARRPPLQPHILACVMEQRHDLDTWTSCVGDECHLVGIDPHLRAVRQIELPELDEDGAAGRRPRRVARPRRIADIAPGREVAGLVLKDPIRTRNSSPPVCTCGEKWLSGA